MIGVPSCSGRSLPRGNEKTFMLLGLTPPVPTVPTYKSIFIKEGSSAERCACSSVNMGTLEGTVGTVGQAVGISAKIFVPSWPQVAGTDVVSGRNAHA